MMNFLENKSCVLIQPLNFPLAKIKGLRVKMYQIYSLSLSLSFRSNIKETK